MNFRPTRIKINPIWVEKANQLLVGKKIEKLLGEGNPDTSEAGGVLSVTQMHCWFNVTRLNMSKLSKNEEEKLTCVNYWEKKAENVILP